MGNEVDILVDVYKPAAGHTGEQPTEQRVARARLGRLLLWLESIPGLRGDGSLDESALFQWVETTRTLASGKDRAKIADQSIGRLLALRACRPG